MLQPVAVFALVTVGFVAPCLIDAARTPQLFFSRLSKRTWLTVIVVCWPAGALAWLLVGRPRRSRVPVLLPGTPGSPRLSAQEAIRRHPAWRSAQLSNSLQEISADAVAHQVPAQPTGPDDDPDFLAELARRIRDARDSG